ncbi:hypothetical protein M3Y99_00654000 [Aphelenchoides fujianensis]|nr:hypothetical protein M3Y99_00654000 [Aphelenchoides fujianensis]
MPESLVCAVCSADGRVASHYGGQVSCLSCKAFFRRHARQHAHFLCAKGGRCEVTPDGRKSCRACRFQRCLSVGMDPKLVQSDRTWDKDARPRWKTLEKKGEKERLAAESTSNLSLQLEVPVDFEGPLGFRSSVKLPERADFAAALRFFREADRFVDEFADTGYTLTAAAPFYRFDVNLSLEEAFLLAPRRLSNRTKILWQPHSFITMEQLQPTWCRSVLYCVDSLSYIPQLRLLEPKDQMRMMVGRGLHSGALLVINRTLRNTKKKCLLASGGTYLPLEPEEVAYFNAEGSIASYLQLAEIYYQCVVEEFKAADLSDEEFLFLRLLSFFAPVKGLTAGGVEIVRSARDYYESLFIRFLCSKMERNAAIERMSQLLALLPVLEQGTAMETSHMSRAMLFNYPELQGKLITDFYSAIVSRTPLFCA